MNLIAWSIVALVAVGVGWRWLSRHHRLPCPAWLGYGVDLPGISTLFGTQQTLERIGVRSGDRVLEIGPGPGRLLIPVARLVQPFGEAVGVDVQPSMITQLKTRAAEAGVTNLTGVVGDAVTTTLPGQFDTVFIALALGEIPEREAVLQRCLEVLKPGGVLSITEMMPDPHFVPQRTVRRLAEGVGFRHRVTRGSSLAFTMNFEKPTDGQTRHSGAHPGASRTQVGRHTSVTRSTRYRARRKAFGELARYCR